MNITNETSVVIYDEIGWGDLIFHEPDKLKMLLTYNKKDIFEVKFLNVERAIFVRLKKPIDERMDYFFNNINLDLLNFLCQKTEFLRAVKSFWQAGPKSFFLAGHFPFLAAAILGNINEY